MALPYKIGSNGAEITAWGQWFAKKYASYAAPVDGYYGNAERDAVKELQRRLGIPITGVFDEQTAARSGFKAGAGAGTPKPVPPRRPIWFYSAPGSGANWDVGPSFEVGRWCADNLNINHQPIGFPKGGYLGLMGGDPTFSYNEVIAAEGVELERLLAINPDVQRAMAARTIDPRAAVDVELWFSGYSQSADGMEDAVVRLFGDGGRFALIRDRINGLVQFGNPSKQNTGIARKTRPDWLYGLVKNVTTTGDFYAEVPLTDKIRPTFYAAIVKAEMELPFFVYILKIAVPIIIEWASKLLPIFGPLLGGFGPMVQLALGTLNGLQGMGNNPLLGNLLGQAGSVDASDPVPGEMLALLSPTGILQNIPGLIGLIGALPGLQAHGEYHLPKPEFGGRTGIQVGCDLVRTFGTEWHK